MARETGPLYLRLIYPDLLPLLKWCPASDLKAPCSWCRKPITGGCSLLFRGVAGGEGLEKLRLHPHCWNKVSPDKNALWDPQKEEGDMREYWVAIVGPVEREGLPGPGLLDPMREAVSAAFAQMVGREPQVLMTSWGCSETWKGRLAQIMAEMLTEE